MIAAYAQTLAAAEWSRLSGADIADIIDRFGPVQGAVSDLLRTARQNYTSDAYEVLNALNVNANLGPDSGLLEWRERIASTEPDKLPLFDQHARIVAESVKIKDAWIEWRAMTIEAET